jgi:hypothetical protein
LRAIIEPMSTQNSHPTTIAARSSPSALYRAGTLSQRSRPISKALIAPKIFVWCAATANGSGTRPSRLRAIP